ncbi:MAG: diacylglycerol kinase family lipid kinase [Cyclobacteriaceae bacterium]|nr:diacylglycerol kinase family lipid kinase [Cyclobacteriaceae bacterium]
MNIAIILNGISRKKKLFYKDIFPALQKEFTVTVFETQYAGHATELAGEAVQNKFETIIAAGGDGTLNQVLNGLLTAGTEKLPVLGLIPLGSGNDFAGAVGLTNRADHLIGLLKQNKPHPTDVGIVSCRDFDGKEKQHYFINVCSLGMGPATVRQMEKAPAWMGAHLRYLTSIIKTFFTHKPEQVELKTQNWNWRGAIRVLAVANGKSFGNRIYLAPDARQDDGMFNLFVAPDVPLFRFLLFLQTLKRSKKIADPQIHYHVADKIEVYTSERVTIEAEGELIGYLPAEIKMLKHRVHFLY